MTKTFWVGIVTILATLASRLWGIEVDDATQQTLVNACQGVAEGVGAVLAIWGAKKASSVKADVAVEEKSSEVKVEEKV